MSASRTGASPLAETCYPGQGYNRINRALSRQGCLGRALGICSNSCVEVCEGAGIAYRGMVYRQRSHFREDSADFYALIVTSDDPTVLLRLIIATCD